MAFISQMLKCRDTDDKIFSFEEILTVRISEVSLFTFLLDIFSQTSIKQFYIEIIGNGNMTI